MKHFVTLLILLAGLFVACHAMAQAAPRPGDLTLRAPDSTLVEIKRDFYGVPHIFGASETGVFFAQGFAAAQDRLVQMWQLRAGARGESAALLGPSQLEFDKQVRTLYYTEQERQALFDTLPVDMQNALAAYAAGVNTYLDSMAANPNKYLPSELRFFTFAPWKVTDSIAMIQFLVRQFGEAGGQELTRLRQLQELGQEQFDALYPINDPTVPTTIPDGAVAPPSTRRPVAYGGPVVRPHVAPALQQNDITLQKGAHATGLPSKFGSFAVLITPDKAANGEAMLLGCPQMGEPQFNATQINNEVELECPTLHVGGMIIAGMPGAIIGRNEHHAWSLTSGMSDNVDIYIETLQDTTMTAYWYNGEWRPFEVLEETILVSGQPVPFTHYRTVHGPVVAFDLPNRQVFAKKMTFWKDELEMMRALFGMIRATNLQEFEDAARLHPMSFNLFYADREQNVKYWHVGRYAVRADTLDPRLPRNGDGSEEWLGFIDFDDLPALHNPAQGYLVNWNNKPVSWWDNGDNVPFRSSISDSAHQTWRVLLMDRYVKPLSNFSFEQLRDTPRQIQSHGTYQQAIAFGPNAVRDENIVPPGQSGFVDLSGRPSPHKNDQWPLHVNWQFKDMLFGVEITTAVANSGTTPQQFSLQQNYPNPFNPSTVIAFELPARSEVVLAIYNSAGQRVRTLAAGVLPAGKHEVVWDANDDGGQRVASGLYFYQLRAGDFTAVRKALVVK